MSDHPMIYAALSAVMADTGVVTKDRRNQSQGFSFRGVDDVVNAVSPALRKHGVIATPAVEVCDVEHGTTTTGKNIVTVRVRVRYRFAAADGSHVDAVVVAESFDSGDKATAKAMSVAFRTALLQTLCLPTDDKDPDTESFERAAPAAPSQDHPRRQTPPAAPGMAEPGKVRRLVALAGGRGIVGDDLEALVTRATNAEAGTLAELRAEHLAAVEAAITAEVSS